MHSINYSTGYSADIPIPDPPKKYEIVKDYVEENEFIRPVTSHDSDFKAEDFTEPHRLNLARLSDLVTDLDLSKHKFELLVSRLHQWNLFLPGGKIKEYRTRETNYYFFEKKEHMVAYIDVNEMNCLNISYDPNNWI
ncbi:hypothetical protein TNIN_89471 [Trichonephila inaurata madagascariensis]|uniref:Uncharacterized protein n=1 Tax=Trichonephila inaurata madagascariensis TaxID=2747483 RepID=A0A8X6YSM7_9ARAC|nr:hypothetical protein TNIN_89471 [Trichonephila inaurata madagascariensis]